MNDLTKQELKAVIEAARDGVERCWIDWVDSGEGREMGVSKRKLRLAEKAIDKLEDMAKGEA